MNLTVGPLPPAVYWRRRVLVLGVLVLLVILVVSMCNGPGQSNAASDRGTPTPIVTSAGASIETSVAAPIIGGSPAPDFSTSPSPVSSSPVVQAPPIQPAAVACADDDLSLIVVVTELAEGFKFTLKIRNTSTRACHRDVGASEQEVHVFQGSDTLWSSDYCQSSDTPSDVRTFGPNIEATFTVSWDGRRWDSGCHPAKGDPPGGPYQVIAKLGGKTSKPVTFGGK